MKPKFLKLCTWLLLFVFLGAGCQKDEIEFADESIVVSNNPGISVYKTKLEYIDKVKLQITEDSILTRALIIDNRNVNTNFIMDKNGDLKSLNRHLLKCGYFVGGNANKKDVYTNITFTEYYNYNIENGVTSWSYNLIEPRIIDLDPYDELYWMGCLDCKEIQFTLGEINEMIENGTLEEYFTRIK